MAQRPRRQWVDGLRGIATFLVAFNHFFNGEIQSPYRSFWAHPSSANRHLIQLPPLRLLWAKDAMVPLFMIISGYSISSNLLQTRNHSPSQLTAHIRSSICRRPIRLFLPVLLLSVPSHLIYYLKGYSHGFKDKVTLQIQPGVAPWRHVGYLLEFLLDGLNSINLQYNEGINEQLWTMSYEFRGSCFTMLTIFIQAPWSPPARLVSLAALMLYMCWYAYWDLLSFVAGLFLAELETDSPPRAGVRGEQSRGTFQALTFAAGVYLLCLPSATGMDDASYPVGYGYLRVLSTWHWTQWSPWLDTQRMLQAVGAVLFFAGTLNAPWLQRFLCTHPVQAMGRISFPVYLLHISVYQLWRAPLRDALWSLFTGEEYPSAEKGGAESLWVFLVVYVLAGVVLGSVVIAAARAYVRYVDWRVARMTRHVDRWLNGDGRDSQSEDRQMREQEKDHRD
ncbi:acyltransferase 3 [Aspergillus multicolor]|uniref:acyltransferase family protein n=1 Tax=Aspergillus multicolor TaxID=41759 RepID=UPI003CCDE225